MSVRVLAPARRIEGVAPRAAEAVFRSLERGRRVFGVAGAHMSHQAADPAYTKAEGHDKSAAAEALEAERDTARTVAQWVEDKPGAVVVYSMMVPGAREERDPGTGLVEGADLDCAIVFGSEVIMLDTCRWKKKKTYSVGEDENVLMTRKPFPGGDVRMPRNIDLWLDYLAEDASVTGLVYVNNEDVGIMRDRAWYMATYRVVNGDILKELLDAKYEQISPEDKETVSSSLVSQLVVRMCRPYDPKDKVMNTGALKGFR